jgi:hypothetical protein
MTDVEAQIAAFRLGLIETVDLLRTCVIHDERLIVSDPPRCARCLKALGLDGAHTHDRITEQLRRMRPNARRTTSIT